MSSDVTSTTHPPPTQRMKERDDQLQGKDNGLWNLSTLDTCIHFKLINLYVTASTFYKLAFLWTAQSRETLLFVSFHKRIHVVWKFTFSPKRLDPGTPISESELVFYDILGWMPLTFAVHLCMLTIPLIFCMFTFKLIQVLFRGLGSVWKRFVSFFVQLKWFFRTYNLLMWTTVY